MMYCRNISWFGVVVVIVDFLMITKALGFDCGSSSFFICTK
jgi:hypothetical protein